MTDRSLLASRVVSLAGVEVLCIGDAMLDRYVYGAVERVSPEAPIPVLRIERERVMLGGAGNVVRNLAALGARVGFLSVVGEDEAGREVERLLGAERGVACRLVREAGRETGIKTRFVAGTQQLLRADRETVRPISAASEAALVAALDDAIARAGAVVLSDYGKGVLTPELLRRAIERARAAGKPAIVDPKAADYACYRGADLVTPNRAELAAATRLASTDAAAIVAAAKSLIATHGFGAVLATRGPDGMSLVSASGEVDHLAAEAREVFDVSGAGDTVVATMAAARAAGIALKDAAALANVAAGIVVGKAGTAVAHGDELAMALRAQAIMSHEAKIAPLAAALERVETWRRQGLKIGFTNGCFDLLHPGHISLFAQARAACDRLVVGLNSDASVKRLKGPSRPVQGEGERAIVLASLASIDLVTIFAEDTPIELIKAIRPDVLVKGADYALSAVVGAEFVQSYGGRVLLAELARGHSTSATLARLAR
ncbi:MAG TPA: D-glycero-beta-D-manno-heptose-7-phosphate kinase [Alphaproteobacteria bacterium]|nr:D-glycero-beta-D-manno-heptose-7-phosphate kinase [Alphaproteobacteria bacterium]